MYASQFLEIEIMKTMQSRGDQCINQIKQQSRKEKAAAQKI
jgi:hypothetical protein